MSDFDWKDFDDANFEYQVQELLTCVPSENIVMSTNTYKTFLKYILWGMALTTIRIKILKLHFILPTIGVILVFLGARGLANTNKGFRGFYILSLIEIVIFIGTMFLQSFVVGYEWIFDSGIYKMFDYLSFVLRLLDAICLGIGIGTL